MLVSSRYFYWINGSTCTLASFSPWPSVPKLKTTRFKSHKPTVASHSTKYASIQTPTALSRIYLWPICTQRKSASSSTHTIARDYKLTDTPGGSLWKLLDLPLKLAISSGRCCWSEQLIFQAPCQGRQCNPIVLPKKSLGVLLSVICPHCQVCLILWTYLSCP